MDQKSDTAEHCILFRTQWVQLTVERMPNEGNHSEHGTGYECWLCQVRKWFFEWFLSQTNIFWWLLWVLDTDSSFTLVISSGLFKWYFCSTRFCPNSDSRRTIKDNIVELIASFYCPSRLKGLPGHMKQVILSMSSRPHWVNIGERNIISVAQKNKFIACCLMQWKLSKLLSLYLVICAKFN